MRNEDAEPFRLVIEDLCTAYNRPCTDAVVRVFWDDLKHLHIGDIRRAAATWRKSGKKFPVARDLMPERKAVVSAPRPVEPDPVMSRWAVAANKALLAVAYQDSRRGFRPMGDRLQRLLAIKAEYVGMAEQTDREGHPMTGMEFSDMCREGFAQALA